MNGTVATGIVGLDVGGANVKAFRLPPGPHGTLSQARGVARTAAFAVWKQPERLAVALADLLASMPLYDVMAVTMTAELCDCFESKRAGVDAVLDAVVAAAEGRQVLVWQTGGWFVALDEARETWLQTAAANWLALATYAGRFARQGRGLLIDVGSTTTDLVPLLDGVPLPAGRTDPERLASGELVYSGVRRTPVCALVREVPWRGGCCAVAAEWFATTHDVYLILGDLAEDANDRNTADGRPATRCRARERLARVICGDREMLTRDDVTAIAETVAAAQMQQCRAALERVTERLGGVPETVVLAGEGEVLARRWIEGAWHGVETPKIISLTEQLGNAASQAACAYAIAVLAQERLCGKERGQSDSGESRLPHDERNAENRTPVVIKVGGSLLDLDDLPERLREFLRRRRSQRPLLVVGGGQAADAVRQLDRRHRLGDDAAHWLAVRAMGFNARLLQAMLPEARVVADPCEAQRCWEEGLWPILDPWEMLWQVERDVTAGTAGPGFVPDGITGPGLVLPHTWDVTGDSIAAWVARRIGARELVLAKSAEIKGQSSLAEAVRLGLVDGYFEWACAELPAVTYINLRAPALSETALRHALPSRLSS